jgi:two-component system phosphate regulon sensor histidine kinase PhoR
MTDHHTTSPVSPEFEALQQFLATQSLQLQKLQTILLDYEQSLGVIRDKVDDFIANPPPPPAPQKQVAHGDENALFAWTLADTAYDALLVVDDSRRIMTANRSARILFDHENANGELLVDVTGSLELDSMVLDALGYQEETFEDQIVLQRRTYRVRAQVVREDKTYIGLALQDITDLVRLNRARRDMVANISHELRTPIANIRLSIDSLFHEQDKPKRKASISALKSIARETDALLWLVQEMYDLSMIESGQSIIRGEDTSLFEIVQEALERMDDMALEKEMKLVQRVPDTIMVISDRDQIRRVLVNLIHNAIKFSPYGGTIAIEASQEAEDAHIIVIDEGPGVANDYVERIFERFYQVDPARSTGMGSGLGLAICKHIVEAHGGRIWVESNQNEKGGRFHFTLPLVESVG